MKKILVVDGQGGKIGRALIERLTEAQKNAGETLYEITAVGTNAVATANMMKAGAEVRGATGENAVAVCARRADIITGAIGIIVADAMLGEITPAIAQNLSAADAIRVLIPMNRQTQCENYVVGVKEMSLSAILDEAAEMIVNLSKK